MSPVNRSHTYIQSPQLQTRRIILFSSDDADKKANAALLMALYAVRLSSKDQASWSRLEHLVEDVTHASIAASDTDDRAPLVACGCPSSHSMPRIGEYACLYLTGDWSG